MNYRIYGTFTLRSPLSHIGEAISTTSYLVQEPILQEDGSVEEVFCYSGNAWRGQMRDLAAMNLLEALELAVDLDPFHLLFSGGRIGGDQSIDVEAARSIRSAIPMIALFGGGVGNQILGGQLAVSNAYPVCREAAQALPPEARNNDISYKSLTFEKSFTRRDDSERYRNYIGDGAGERGDGPADQMRTTAELVIPGTQLYSEIELSDPTEAQLGCLVSALQRFAAWPHIGGQAGRGHGRTDLHYRILGLEEEADYGLIKIEHGQFRLSSLAEQAQEAYREHVMMHADEIRRHLCG